VKLLERARRAPVTLAAAGLSILFTALAPERLLGDAGAIARGQLWRLLTGPLVHASASHLAWDVTILLVLGLAYEPRLRRAMALTLVFGLAVPTAAVFLADPSLRVYYGTSGATHALMAAALAFELGRGNRSAFVLALAVAFVAKLAWGVFGTGPLVGPALAANVRETPAAHLAGALVGVSSWLVTTRRALHWVAVLALAMSACAPKTSFSAADRKDVEDVLARQREAWNRGDLAGYMEGYARTPDLVFTSGGKIRRGWDEAKASYQARYGEDRAGMGQLGFEILSVQPVGADGAIVLGRWRLTDTPQAGSGVFSVVLERRPEGWRIVHDHTSSD
jgi:rhomboid family GlyGly-CTERM serine protease